MTIACNRNYRIPTYFLVGVLACYFTVAFASPVTADGPVTAATDSTDTDRVAARHAAFEQRLTGSSLIGQFTKMSKDAGDDTAKATQPLTEERYDIRSVTKAEQGDFWIINARIRYGHHDLVVPVPVEVKWAGETAVIMLNKVTIPGMGTFDAHVLIHEAAYAGTWRHDDLGGHLFGRIEKTEKE